MTDISTSNIHGPQAEQAQIQDAGGRSARNSGSVMGVASAEPNTNSSESWPTNGAYGAVDDRALTEQELNQEDHDIMPYYTVGEKLGRGGCAVVFEGWRKSDNFHVAIKQLTLAASLEENEQRIARKRFYREAKLIASLHEPHIVQCVDYGVIDGQPCMVLEFIKGQELGDYMKSLHESLGSFGINGVPIEDAIDITIQVLKALEVSHSMTVIHRDIKPGNIMVLDDDRDGKLRIKVLDFGIATVLDNVENNNTLMTQQGNIRGTPAYMAPELFTGDVRASVESDLYAVGLVLLECLTNKVAFEGSSFMQVAYKQVNEDPEIPSFIPECIANIIQKACSKKNADRYHSAADFIHDLEANADQAIKAYPKCLANYSKSNGKSHFQLRTVWKNYSRLIILIASVFFLIVVVVVMVVALSSHDYIDQAALHEEVVKAENEKNQALLLKEEEARAALESVEAQRAEAEREIAERERQTFLIGRDFTSEKVQGAWIATINNAKTFFDDTAPSKPKTTSGKTKSKKTTKKVNQDPFINILQSNSNKTNK